jgi:DNA-dependent RNA polymerase auxiliary subunit epsilon
MVYPFVANKIEQLELDPVKKIDGYVWYNTVEKVYKTWVGDDLQIFITDAIFANNVDELVQQSLDERQFTVGFENAYSINVKHNRGTEHFVYSLFDSVEKTQLNVQMEILNENEVKIEFVDPVTGNLFMYFQ